MQHPRTPHLLKNQWPTASILFSLEYFDEEALYKPIYTGWAKCSSRDLSGQILDVIDTLNLKDRCRSNQSSLSTSPHVGLLIEGNCTRFTSWFIHIASEDAKMQRHAYRCDQDCESRLLHLEMNSFNFHCLALHSPRKLHLKFTSTKASPYPNNQCSTWREPEEGTWDSDSKRDIKVNTTNDNASLAEA